MKIQRIRHKLLIVLALSLSVGFTAIAYFYTKAMEHSIIRDYQLELHRLTDSVVMNVETIMKENHAEIMPDFARRLKSLQGTVDFRIARVDGTEAYLDNETIDAVNLKLDEHSFPRRTGPAGKTSKVFNLDDQGVAEALKGREAVLVRTESAEGTLVHFYDPILNGPKCIRCHESKEPVRGVVKLTTSMAEVERDMMKARVQSLIVLVISLVLTMGITGYMLGRFIARPIEEITAAMASVTGGNFAVRVTSDRRDELGSMARSFNKMAVELQRTYENMRREQEKLYSVLQGAKEAVVVTDAAGQVVLVNDSAAELLGKSNEQIKQEGILHLVNQPERFRTMLDDLEEAKEPTLLEHNGRWLLASVQTIRDEEHASIGSAALLRDVTLEQALLKELERLSITDALTDVFNRRHLDAKLKVELNRAKEIGLSLAVIMFDADHFKKFNDTYGHDQGDRVLKMVGQVMKEAIRVYDIPCRYGGEEFLVILPSVDPEGAIHVAERLRKDIEAMTVDGLKVTVSLGVACFPMLPAESPESMVEAADRALYHSKEQGRNCSTLATVEMIQVAKTG